MSIRTDTGIIGVHPHRQTKTVTVSVKDNDGVEASVTLDKRDVATIAAAMKMAVGFPVHRIAL